MDANENQQFVELRERMARVEERQNSADRAANIIADSLNEYKISSNEWRQTLNDQRALFVSRGEVIAIVSVILLGMGTIAAVVGLLLRRPQ